VYCENEISTAEAEVGHPHSQLYEKKIANIEMFKIPAGV
jgi:hypothetical protein